MQFKGKLMNQAWENGKNPNFGPDFGPFWPKFGPKIFFPWLLSLLDVIHCCKLSLYAIWKKTNEQNLRKWKKTSFGLDFGPFGANLGFKNIFSKILPLIDLRHCRQLLLNATSRTTNEPNLIKWQKNLVSGPILTHLTQSRAAKLFFQNSGSANH